MQPQFSYFSRCLSPPFSRIGSPEHSTDDQQISGKAGSPPPSNDSPIDMAPESENVIGRSVPIMTEIHSAIYAGADAQTVEEIIGYDGGESNSDVNETVCGFTAAMLVCLYGRSVDTLKVLVKHGAELNVKDDHLCNTLHFACGSGQFAIVQYVVEIAEEKGYLDTWLADCDQWGNSVLHYVTGKPFKNDLKLIEDAIKIVKLLVDKGLNLNIQNLEGKSALHWAALNSNEKLAEELISVGANPYTPDNSGSTAASALAEPKHFIWETPSFLRLEGRDAELQKPKVPSSTYDAYVAYPNQALQGLDVLPSFTSLPGGQSDLQRLAIQLQQIQSPQDIRSILAKLENAQCLTMMEQLLYQQNQVMNDKVFELQRENMILRERLTSMDRQLQKYKVQLESSAQILLQQLGGPTGLNNLNLQQ
eukprot:TRINITY_DN8611_c0_g2_i1.p2 TRINITY_DN8611_c0_g2~~TRINITY_DN8611_c0_g2_i1.p2  ORF type:complete len:420 (-),score=54.42 TRINITY_DN8611_c0_g2_i1:1534-2793(-)